jgi:hypothetical protein
MSSVWHLKKANGKRFGPVGLSELQAWARSGRIVPEDWLSVDGHNWRAADSFAPLEMICLVTYRNVRRYGPIHPRHLAELLILGDVHPNDPAENLRSGEKGTALRIALRALLDAEARVRVVEMEKESAPEVPPEPVITPEEREALVLRAEAAEGERDQLRSEVERLAAAERERELTRRALSELQSLYERDRQEWMQAAEHASATETQVTKAVGEAEARARKAEQLAVQLQERLDKLVKERASAPPAVAPEAKRAPESAGRLDEAHIRLKVAIAEKQRLEAEVHRLRQRLDQARKGSL